MSSQVVFMPVDSTNSASVHWLPCRIAFSGKANVTEKFLPIDVNCRDESGI